MVNFIEKYFDVTPDPRSMKLYLMGSPFQIMLLLTIYVCFVKKWGPLFMQNRKPFELKAVLIVYNILQIIVNASLVFVATPIIVYHREWIGSCLRISERDPEIEKIHMRLSYSFCMVKLFDLCDTIFFVLRKRYKQISFLHFYHHLMVSAAACIIFRYVPNGPVGVMGYVNSIVHTVMYFYYLLSSYKPNLKQSIWWKKYITVMQMVQFVFVSVFMSYPWLRGENCGYPFKLYTFAWLQNFVLLYLFNPNSKESFIIGSLKQTYFIVAVYAFFVKILGPRLMKKRKPYELKTVLMIYNILQVCINGYLVIMSSFYIFSHYQWIGRCYFIDDSTQEIKNANLWLTYTYCFVKIIDLLDTVFFVLRKRYKQVSFLHFYHHLLLALVAPTVFHYVPNGHLTIMGYVNSIVHTVMYFYYFLSSLRPDMKNYIWWKKYITLLQMVQFVFLIGFFLYPLVKGELCGYPFPFLYFSLFQNIVFLVLFSNFYIKTYVSKSKQKT